MAKYIVARGYFAYLIVDLDATIAESKSQRGFRVPELVSRDRKTEGAEQSLHAVVAIVRTECQTCPFN